MAGNIKVGSAGSNGTTTFQSNETADRTINLPNASVTLAAQTVNATNQTSNLVAAPTGIANTSGLMLGLSNLASGIIVTPQTTGRIFISINGVVAQSTTADGAFWHVRTGTGAAPANGGALAGAQVGGQQSMVFLTGILKIPFSIQATKTGLAVGTAVWIDLVLATVTGGTATMTQVQVDVFEF